MVFNLNIADLTITVTLWNKSYFIYKKIYYSIKLSTIPLRTKFIWQKLQFP
jgi:hypothetical protein